MRHTRHRVFVVVVIVHVVVSVQNPDMRPRYFVMSTLLYIRLAYSRIMRKSSSPTWSHLSSIVHLSFVSISREYRLPSWNLNDFPRLP